MIQLLYSQSLTVRNRFQAERIALQLSERQSTATLTLSDSAPALNVGAWLKWESGPGAGIVWRVRSIDEQMDKRTRTVSLEHMIQSLRDRIMFGETTTKDISGNDTATAKQAVNFILSKSGSDWTLGGIDYNVSNPYSFNGDSRYDGLETISSTLEDCIWEYDFSTYPFKLYIRKMSSAIYSEMRSDRNIVTLKKTIDRSRMYTRIYPIGKNNLHIDENYVQKNTATYGIVCKVETDQSISDKDQLKAWAERRLNRHCEPVVTVTISGMELAEATGEPLDSFRIGKMCRIPLPEFSTTITERVTKLSYSDILRDPMSVTITLANELTDVQTILREQAASGGRGARTGAKNAEEDHAWIMDTTDHVAMVAEAVAGPEEGGKAFNWSRVSEIVVDGQGIHQRVTKAEGEIIVAESAIEQTESSIGMVVKGSDSRQTVRYLNRKSFPSKGDDKHIYLDVETGTYYEYKNGAYRSIKAPTNKIATAEIITAVNADGSTEARIKADHVKITGSTTLAGVMEIDGKYLNVKKTISCQGNIQLLTSGSWIQCPEYVVPSNGCIKASGAGNGEFYKLTAAEIKTMVVDAEVSADEKTLTLTKNDGTIVNFKKAAAVAGNWSGTTYTVTGGYNDLTTTVYLAIDGVISGGDWSDTINAKIYADDPSLPENLLTTQEMKLRERTNLKYVELYTGTAGTASYLQKGKVSTEATYNAGWNYGLSRLSSGGRAATSEQYIKRLGYEELWTVWVKGPRPDGTEYETTYTVKGPEEQPHEVDLSGAWNLSSKKFTVTENETGETYSETLQYEKGTGYNSQSDTYTVNTFSDLHYAYARVKTSNGQGGGVLYGFKIDATGQYSGGWDASRALVSHPTSAISSTAYGGDFAKLTVLSPKSYANYTPENPTTQTVYTVSVRSGFRPSPTSTDTIWVTELKAGNGNVVARASAQDAYNAGIADAAGTVTISSITGNGIGSTDLQTEPVLTATASNGNTGTQKFTLQQTSYSPVDGQTNYCVNLRRGGTSGTIVGRIDVQNVYNKVTITGITASPIGADVINAAPTLTATASNGNTADQRLTMVRDTFTQSGTTKNCVVLKRGSTIIGRINTQNVYDSVTVDSISGSAVGAAAVQETPTLTATASNGKQKTQTVTLEKSSYNPMAGQTDRCVNLKIGSTVIGRIDTQSVYADGWNAVTVSDIYGESQVSDSATSVSPKIVAKASNGAIYKETATLQRSTYTPASGTTLNCVNLVINNKIVGRISTNPTYEAGVSDGKTLAGVTYNTSTHKISRALSSTKKEYVITVSQGTWQNGNMTVNALIDGSTVINSLTIAAPSFSALDMAFSCTDQGNPSYDSSNPDKYNGKNVTATVKNGNMLLKSGSQPIWLTAGSFSNGRAAINARMTDENGDLISRAWVSMPASASSWTKQQVTGNQWQIKCVIGGKEYSTTMTF